MGMFNSLVGEYDRRDVEEGLRQYMQHRFLGRVEGTPSPLAEAIIERHPTQEECMGILATSHGQQIDANNIRAALNIGLSSDYVGDLWDSAARLKVTSAFVDMTQDAQRYAPTVSLSNFEETQFGTVEVGNLPSALPSTGEGKSLQAFKLASAGVAIKLHREVRKLLIGRQLLQNDDMGIVSAMLADVGTNGARLFNQDAATALEANGNLSDGTAAMDATRGNVLTDAAVSATSLSNMVSALRSRSLDNGQKAGAQPRYWLVPPSYEMAARTVVTAAYQPGDPNAVQVISNPWLGGSYHYLLADSAAPSLVCGVWSGQGDQPVSVYPSAAPKSLRESAGFEGQAFDVAFCWKFALVGANVCQNTTA